METAKSRIIRVGEIAENKVICNYEPKKFPVQITKQAVDFEKTQGDKTSDFHLSEIVAELTGIAAKRKLEAQHEIEEETLKKLKVIEEKAYEEAYDLGLIEGDKKAFQEKTNEINKRLNDLDQLISYSEHMTTKLAAEKESQIIKLITHIATKIAMFEIKSNPEKIIDLIKQLLEEMQGDERVIVRIAPSDAEFIKQAREAVNNEGMQFTNIKFESDDEVSPGGCIMESSYGAIDATVERRVAQVWEAITERLPRIPDDRIEVDANKFQSTHPESKDPANKKTSEDKE